MKFIVYSKDNCPHCTRAILRLTQANKEFVQLKLGEDFSREHLLQKFPQAKTFPQIEYFSQVDGYVHVGGADDLEKFLTESK